MIFHRALLREFAGLAGAVFMALFAIALTTQLIRLLGKAAGGSIPSDAVIAFLGFFSLGALPVLLSLTMFISVLLTLTRGWRDSEMVIWFTCGLPLTAWLKPVMLFALPQIAVIGALSLFISPWAAQMGAQYANKLESRNDVTRVTPGVFGETSNKERVFFVESVSGETNQVQNVFLSSVQQGKGGVSMSRSGRTETAPNGDRFIVLEQGRRYEGSPGDELYRVTEFDRYAARIETRENIEPERNQKNLPTWSLINRPTKENLAELGKVAYDLRQWFTFVLLHAPAHAYELFPIVVLIGTLYVLAHLASNSEYTVMRGSGLSPARAAAALFKIGMAFVVLTFVIGEWMAPTADEAAQKTKMRALSSMIGQDLQSGLWFKDEGSFINVRESREPKLLQGVRIYEFDAEYRLRKITFAQRAEYRAKGVWQLYDTIATRFDPAGPQTAREPQAEWHTGVSPDLLN